MLALKVLDENMRSANGGEQQWRLGEKVTAKGKLVICENGIHLTYQPNEWRGTRVFVAKFWREADFNDIGMKLVCRSATLLCELSPKQLKAYKEGEAQLWKAYEEGEAPLRKAYKEGCQKLLMQILKKQEAQA